MTRRELPECRYCRFYASDPHLVCAIHPSGPSCDRCLDFREDDTALRCWSEFLGLDWSRPEDELWQPASPPEYAGEFVLQFQRRLTLEEQVHLLDTHPLFTGRCPDCDYAYPQDAPPPVQWRCPQCGWQED
jgi:hypothetical protein